jgi:hypothetical protein
MDRAAEERTKGRHSGGMSGWRMNTALQMANPIVKLQRPNLFDFDQYNKLIGNSRIIRLPAAQ